jgi:glycosyltransferase involved in cell wall biosynthesis
MPDLRALHVHSGNLVGGVETALISLAAHRAAAPGLEQHFALAFHGETVQRLAATGAAVWHLGAVRASRPWTVRRGRQALQALIAEIDPTIVLCHAPWSQAIFAPGARRGGRPVVYWQHGAVTGKHWLERWARRTAPDLAICNSRFTASTLPRLYSGVASEVLHYAIAPAAPGRPREEVRRALGTGAETPVIIQVSRMEPWKGQRDLLRALARLEQRPEWECWVVGGAQRPPERRYQAELEALARRWNLAARVRFLGQRTDVADLLGAADLFCQPNTDPEPFGITFVEALYAGLPVVTAALGGALEIVDDSCGVLVEPRDAAALARALGDLLDDPARRTALADAAPARARRLCDPAAQLPQLHDILHAVVRRP